MKQLQSATLLATETSHMKPTDQLLYEKTVDVYVFENAVIEYLGFPGQGRTAGIMEHPLWVTT